MLLDRATRPKNTKAIKSLRKQIDEIFKMADHYRDFKFDHNVMLWGGKGGDWAWFTMDIDPTPEGDIDTFIFESQRKPDKKFINHASSLFSVSKEKWKLGEVWKISMTKEQFSNSNLLNELLSWLFEDWDEIELRFDNEEELEAFEELYDVLIPYGLNDDTSQETESSSKSWGKKGAAAAATTTGFFVAYTEEEVSYADDDDSGFDFPEF
jgi:hypothetical protein